MFARLGGSRVRELAYDDVTAVQAYLRQKYAWETKARNAAFVGHHQFTCIIGDSAPMKLPCRIRSDDVDVSLAQSSRGVEMTLTVVATGGSRLPALLLFVCVVATYLKFRSEGVLFIEKNPTLDTFLQLLLTVVDAKWLPLWAIPSNPLK
jgi:hypothetical protein